MANEGTIQSEDQVVAFEKRKRDDLACGEIETAHSGNLGSQDTFYVGNLKRLGVLINKPLWTLTVEWHFVSSTTTKTPITAADTLSDIVLTYFSSDTHSQRFVFE